MLISRRRLLQSGVGAASLQLQSAGAWTHGIGNPNLYEGLVASRARMMGQHNNAANKQIMMRSAHIASETLTSIRVCFQNFYNCTNQGGAPIADTGPGATTAITAAIEYNGSSQQLKFSASPNGTIPDGGTLWSDYLTVSIPSGATFWVRSFTTNNSANGIIYNNWQNSSLGECITLAASGLSDLTLSTGTFTNTIGWSAPPLAIVGMTTNPSMIIVCDSIGAGQADTEDSSNSATGFNGKVGTVARSLSCPFVIIGRSGAQAQTWTTSATAADAIIQNGSHLFIGLGTNDIASGQTPAQIIASLQSIAALGRANQKKYIGTLAPRSGGSWSTGTIPGGQTPDGNASARASLDTSIRGVISGTTGTYNIASALESSQDSGYWIVTPSPPYTGDGVHPNAAGNLLVPAAGVISPVAWP